MVPVSLVKCFWSSPSHLQISTTYRNRILKSLQNQEKLQQEIKTKKAKILLFLHVDVRLRIHNSQNLKKQLKKELEEQMACETNMIHRYFDINPSGKNIHQSLLDQAYRLCCSSRRSGWFRLVRPRKGEVLFWLLLTFLTHIFLDNFVFCFYFYFLSPSSWNIICVPRLIWSWLDLNEREGEEEEVGPDGGVEDSSSILDATTRQAWCDNYYVDWYFLRWMTRQAFNKDNMWDNTENNHAQVKPQKA